jgi:hypothetical protein
VFMTASRGKIQNMAGDGLRQVLSCDDSLRHTSGVCASISGPAGGNIQI